MLEPANKADCMCHTVATSVHPPGRGTIWHCGTPADSCAKSACHNAVCIRLSTVIETGNLDLLEHDADVKADKCQQGCDLCSRDKSFGKRLCIDICLCVVMHMQVVKAKLYTGQITSVNKDVTWMSGMREVIKLPVAKTR